MNILILSWRGPQHPLAGGAEYVTHEHAKAWVRHGNEVTLFTSFFRGAKETEKIDGVQIIRKGQEFIGVHFAAFCWYLFGKHPKYDLVVDHFHGIPFFTPLYIRGKKLAFIHEVAKEVWFLNYNFFIALIGFIAEPLIFRLFYSNIKFITVSPSTKRELVKWGIPEKNVEVIFNGVSLYNLPQKVRQKEKVATAVYLGALTKDKGIEDALKVFQYMSEIGGDWKFWIIGKGDENYLRSLKKLVKKLGISQKTTFWGFVSDRKKFELLGKAHVLVNPSVLEGWGLVNIEANAVGTPVVGYDVSGMKDSVIHGKTGILVTKGNYIKMAKSAVKLVENRDEYKKYQRNGFKYAKRFSWYKSTQESLRLIEGL